MVSNVCRLCLGVENTLMWIFDTRMAVNMQEVVNVICSVEITKTDELSQKVCMQCCTILLKVFKFRKRTLHNQEQLKLKLAETKLREELDLPNKIHPSIINMKKEHPNTKFPPLVSADYLPSITLLTDEVPDWLAEHNSNLEIALQKALNAYQNQSQPTELSLDKRKRKRTESTQSCDTDTLSTSSSSKSSDTIPLTKLINRRISSTSVESSNSSTKKIKLTSNTAAGTIEKKTEKENANIESQNAAILLKNKGISMKIVEGNSNIPGSIKKKSEVIEKHLPDPNKQSSEQSNLRNSILNPTGKKKPSSELEATLKGPLSSIEKEKPITDVGRLKNTLNAKVKRKTSSDLDILNHQILNSISKSIQHAALKSLPAENKKAASSELDIVKSAISNLKEKKAASSELDLVKSAMTNLKEKNTQSLEKKKCSDVDNIKKPLSDFQFLEKILNATKSNSSPVSKESTDKSKTTKIIISEEKESDNSDIIIMEHQYAASSEVITDSSSSLGESSGGNRMIESDDSSNTSKKIDTTINNLLDTDLVASVVKTHKLVNCKICDLMFPSNKSLKVHLLVHKVCPFCGEKFKTIAEKNEHVGLFCPKNVILKKPKLELQRIDEQEEFVKKYPQLLDKSNYYSYEEEEIVEKQTAPLITNLKANEDSLFKQSSPIILNYLLNGDDNDTAIPNMTSVAFVNPNQSQNKSKDDLIYTGVSYNIKPTFKVKGNEFMSNLEVDSDDLTKVKFILNKLYKPIGNVLVMTNANSSEKSIVMGSTERSFLLKGLKSDLLTHRIPVEITHGKKLEVSFGPRSQTTISKKTDFWNDLNPIDLVSSAQKTACTDTQKGKVPLTTTSTTLPKTNKVTPLVTASSTKSTVTTPQQILATHNKATLVPNNRKLVSISNPLPTISTKTHPITTQSQICLPSTKNANTIQQIASTTNPNTIQQIASTTNPNTIQQIASTTNPNTIQQIATPQITNFTPNRILMNYPTANNLVFVPNQDTNSGSTSQIAGYLVVPNSIQPTSNSITNSTLPIIQSVQTVSTVTTTSSVQPALSATNISPVILNEAFSAQVIDQPQPPQRSQQIRVKKISELS